MTKEIIKFAALFVVMALCQVVIFNHICLFGVAIPLVFIYFILKLPITLHTNWLLTLAFIMGCIIDIFSNTLGVNTLSCTILAMLKQPILNLYIPRHDELSNPTPSFRSIGLSTFARYAITSVATYCVLYFSIEAFSLFAPLITLARIICSSLLTFIIILAFESLASTRS